LNTPTDVGPAAARFGIATTRPFQVIKPDGTLEKKYPLRLLCMDMSEMTRYILCSKKKESFLKMTIFPIGQRCLEEMYGFQE
jgi:hypothetical protein